MQDAVIIQRPEASNSDAAELVLLFHGVGSSAENLRPLGELLAGALSHAWIVSVGSPDASELGGWQWFSVQGITEANRPARVAATMPRFLETIARWQRESGAYAETTTLIGFSQGAIMALESTQLPTYAAGRVIAIAGRFAQPPRKAPSNTRLHLLHGDQDQVMPVALAIETARQLEELGANVTLAHFSGLAHGIDARVARRLIERLREHPGATP